MTILNGIILGLLHGLTEFLPISSSGHAAIINSLFNIETASDGHLMLEATMQLGTLIAVLVVFWQDLVRMIEQAFGFGSAMVKEDPYERLRGAKLLMMMLLGSLPMILILPIYDMLQSLMTSNLFIGTAMILTGTATYVSEQILGTRKTEMNMTIFDALLIGLCQIVGSIPGFSHIGITYGGCLATGLKREFALRYTFLLFIPVSLGSVFLKFSRALAAGVEFANMSAYLVAMAAAILSSIGAILLCRYIVERYTLRRFGFYALTAGVIFIILTLIF